MIDWKISLQFNELSCLKPSSGARISVSPGECSEGRATGWANRTLELVQATLSQSRVKWAEGIRPGGLPYSRCVQENSYYPDEVNALTQYSTFTQLSIKNSQQ